MADFARAHGITFPLLSDPKSEVIKRFGILNTLIDPSDHPWFGIPYPGSYVVDADGKVQAKFFESSLNIRASADDLLRSATGETVDISPAPTPNGDGAAVSEVTVDVSYDGETMVGGVLRDLLVRFRVPRGHHLYAAPAPPGMVAAEVKIEPAPGLVVRPAKFPETHPHQLAGTDEVLEVFTDEVTVRIPVAHQSRSLISAEDGTSTQRIEGTVRWQSCDDQACGRPASHRFSINLPAIAHLAPQAEFGADDGMDIAVRFEAMVTRSGDKDVAQVMSDMAGAD